MLRYAIIPPEADLIEEVADRCETAGNDYSGNLVVFPGKRPAHFLRKCIAAKRGTAFVPPVILSMEEFIDRIYGEMHPAAPRRMETIDAVAFLFEIHRGMERPLGGKEFLNLETFFPLGLRIYHDIEELLIEQVEARQLKAVENLVDAPRRPRPAPAFSLFPSFSTPSTGRSRGRAFHRGRSGSGTWRRRSRKGRSPSSGSSSPASMR